MSPALAAGPMGETPLSLPPLTSPWAQSVMVPREARRPPRLPWFFGASMAAKSGAWGNGVIVQLADKRAIAPAHRRRWQQGPFQDSGTLPGTDLLCIQSGTPEAARSARASFVNFVPLVVPEPAWEPLIRRSWDADGGGPSQLARSSRSL